MENVLIYSFETNFIANKIIHIWTSFSKKSTNPAKYIDNKLMFFLLGGYAFRKTPSIYTKQIPFGIVLLLNLIKHSQFALTTNI